MDLLALEAERFIAQMDELRADVRELRRLCARSPLLGPRSPEACTTRLLATIDDGLLVAHELRRSLDPPSRTSS